MCKETVANYVNQLFKSNGRPIKANLNECNEINDKSLKIKATNRGLFLWPPFKQVVDPGATQVSANFSEAAESFVRVPFEQNREGSQQFSAKRVADGKLSALTSLTIPRPANVLHSSVKQYHTGTNIIVVYKTWKFEPQTKSYLQAKTRAKWLEGGERPPFIHMNWR